MSVAFHIHFSILHLLQGCTTIAGGLPTTIQTTTKQEFGISNSIAISDETPFLAQNLW